MRIKSSMKLPALLLAFGLFATACSSDDPEPESTGDETTDTGSQDGDAAAGGSILQRVKDRGKLICGGNDQLPGFGSVNEAGEFEGFDIDYCKAIAAGVLGDAEAVEIRPLTASERFTALQAGEVDVLIRNTTFTATRDGQEGATFLTTTFYDGQGMMVQADSGFETLEDMEGTAICVLSGTTTELNLASVFNAQGISYEPLSFEDNATLQTAFEEGQCDGWTTDKSGLAGIRSSFPDEKGGPDSLKILDVTMSKEPLGPATPDGDSQWAQAVNWIVLATIQAEEFGIDSTNVDSADTSNPEIARFLGAETEDGTIFDPGLGLPTDFAKQVVSQVGNYAEIYNRHVGPDTPLGLERGVNSLWTDGGLLYSPPFR